MKKTCLAMIVAAMLLAMATTASAQIVVVPYYDLYNLVYTDPTGHVEEEQKKSFFWTEILSKNGTVGTYALQKISGEISNIRYVGAQMRFEINGELVYIDPLPSESVRFSEGDTLFILATQHTLDAPIHVRKMWRKVVSETPPITGDDVAEFIRLLKEAPVKKFEKVNRMDGRGISATYSVATVGAVVVGYNQEIGLIFFIAAENSVFIDNNLDGKVDEGILMDAEDEKEFQRSTNVGLENEAYWQEIFGKVVIDTIDYLSEK